MMKFNKSVKYATPGSACFDLESTESLTLNPGDIKAIGTGLFIEDCPNSMKLEIFSRSGLACKGVIVANAPGQVDSDYKNEIKVILINLGSKEFDIKVGDRIAQAAPTFVLGIVGSTIINDNRNGGLGSTGL